MHTLALFPIETDGSELPGQRLPNTGRHNHHEGAKNGPHHVCVLPGRPDRPVWIHCLLPIQVCPAWLSGVTANGGEPLASRAQIHLFAQISTAHQATLPSQLHNASG